jgi:hypothetical protein
VRDAPEVSVFELERLGRGLGLHRVGMRQEGVVDRAITVEFAVSHGRHEDRRRALGADREAEIAEEARAWALRYRSLTREGWVRSLSRWRDEKAVVRRRTKVRHHEIQEKARAEVFLDCHLRVADAVRRPD